MTWACLFLCLRDVGRALTGALPEHARVVGKFWTEYFAGLYEHEGWNNPEISE